MKGIIADMSDTLFGKNIEDRLKRLRDDDINSLIKRIEEVSGVNKTYYLFVDVSKDKEQKTMIDNHGAVRIFVQRLVEQYPNLQYHSGMEYTRPVTFFDRSLSSPYCMVKGKSLDAYLALLDIKITTKMQFPELEAKKIVGPTIDNGNYEDCFEVEKTIRKYYGLKPFGEKNETR